MFRKYFLPILLFLSIEEIQAWEQPILKTDVYQEPGTAIFLELLGKPLLSLNVDFRINKSNRFSFGIQPLNYDSPEAFRGSSYIIPNLMYYRLRGEKYSKFEVGGGLSVFYEDLGVHVIFHGVLGYRYQKKNGRLFRIGFTPLVVFPRMLVFMPWFGISFGYSR